MLIIKLMRFLLGYLKINIWGKFPERFLNVLAGKGIKIWSTCRRGENIELCILAKDYKKVPKLRRKCPVKVRTKQKRGMPFIFRKYRRRSGLAVGLAIYVAALVMMPKIVWGVNVSGNTNITDEQLQTALRDVGIYSGASIKDIDAPNMRLNLCLLLPEISWAAVNVEGCFVNVEIREAEELALADKRPCNLVADCDGVVKGVFVRAGLSTVKVGDGVRKGDMLVSGTEQYSSGVTKFRHSEGEIIAQVEKQITVKVPLNQIKTTYTGKVATRRVLTAFDCDIPLYIGEVRYDYRLERVTTPIKIQNTRLPFVLTEGRFYERVQTPYLLSQKEAQKKALTELEKIQQSQLKGFSIIERNLQYKPTEKELELTATYICEGNIAKKEYIYISEG